MAKVLIIGATSAIAAEVAALLAARGDELFLVARNEVNLASLRAALGPRVAGSARADLTDTAAADRLVTDAIDGLGGLDTAIVAHGLLGDQEQTEADWHAAREVIETNFSSVVALLVPIANYLSLQSRGRIVVLSSVAGERGRPRNYTYGAAKGALTIYLQGLRSRLWGTGVEVHTIKLGPVDSPMTASHPKNVLFSTPGRVARSIVRLLEGRGGEAFVPWYWAPIMRVVCRLPEPLFQRFRFLSGR